MRHHFMAIEFNIYRNISLKIYSMQSNQLECVNAGPILTIKSVARDIFNVKYKFI